MGLLSKIVCICLLACVVNGANTTNEIQTFELKNGNISIKVTNYGAHLMSVICPDKNGNLDDVLLGYDTAKEYVKGKTTLGATLGRVSNRIKNAQFTFNGTTYKLEANDGNNTINSGRQGYSKVYWNVKQYLPDAKRPRLVLSYDSFDGEQGFPGNLSVTVTYALSTNNALTIIMKAKALNKATPVNLVFHPFWNLGGQASGDILSEELQIYASKYTPTDEKLIPTGEIAPVKGTAYDFLEARTVGSRIGELPAGYDINYALDGVTNRRGFREISLAAVLSDKKTGRRLEMLTNQPGLQVYSGDKLDLTGKGGAAYKAYAGIALEAQGYPNAVNQPNFPSQIVFPGEMYKHYVVMKFSAN